MKVRLVEANLLDITRKNWSSVIYHLFNDGTLLYIKILYSTVGDLRDGKGAVTTTKQGKGNLHKRAGGREVDF